MWLRALFEDGDDLDRGAGCIFLAADTNRLLLAHRSREVHEPGTFATFGGTVNPDETALTAMKREMQEETGYDGTFKTKPLFVFKDDLIQYSNFLVIVPNEFEPRLNWENQGYVWCEFGEWPSPLHPGLKALLTDPASLVMLTNKSSLKKDNVTSTCSAVISVND